MPKTHTHTHKGFTLLEIVVSMFCFAIVGLALSQIFVVTQKRSHSLSGQSESRIAVRTALHFLSTDVQEASFLFSSTLLTSKLGTGNPLKVDVGGVETSASLLTSTNDLQVLVVVKPETSNVRPTWEVVAWFLEPISVMGDNGAERHRLLRFVQKGVANGTSGLPSDIDLDNLVGEKKAFECLIPAEGFVVSVGDSGEGALVEVLVDSTGEDGVKTEHFQTFVTARNAM